MSTTTTTEIVVSDAEEARLAEATAEVPEIVARAGQLQVHTHEQAVEATEFLSRVAGAKKRAEEARVFIVKPMNDHVKTINERVKTEVAPLEEADQIVRGKVQTFNQEQARLRQEQEAAARAEAQRQEREAQEQRDREAADARAEAERAVEAARVAREEAERAEAARNAEQAGALAQEMAAMSSIDLASMIQTSHLHDPAKVAAARKEMERRREHRQAQDRAREETERAEAAQIAAREAADRPPVEAPVPEATPATPLRSESGSIATRKRWAATIEDPHAVPREYMVPDQKAINEAVRAGVREIPGVKIEQVEDLAVRAK